VLTRPVVLGALATTVLGAGAMFTLYTYVAPTLAQLTGASPAFVTAMLLLIGIGFSIGNIAGGRLADRSLDGSLIGFLVLLIVTMLAFPVLAKTHLGAAAALLVWGIATFAVVPPLQMRVMRAAAEAPGLASSVNVGAFNLGNALGAAAGGAAISAGFGYAAVPIVGAVIAAAGLALVGLQVTQRRTRVVMNP
jgi:DHA1 family inner membrane transport protein